MVSKIFHGITGSSREKLTSVITIITPITFNIPYILSG